MGIKTVLLQYVLTVTLSIQQEIGIDYGDIFSTPGTDLASENNQVQVGQKISD